MILNWPLHTPTKAEARMVPDKFVATSHEEGRIVPAQGRVIFCYSRASVTAGFGDQLGVWTETLRNCRGLIFDYTGNVVCRGLPKFFNYSEGPLGEWKPEYDNLRKVMTRKVDGFCAHLWFDPSSYTWRCTTKGGSEHDFEDYGLELLCQHKLIGNWPELDPSCVYIAEGCHSSDDHVLKEEVGLHLIGIINADKNMMQIDTSGFLETIEVSSLEEAVALQNAALHEGYVMYLFDETNTIRHVMKFKSPFYVQRRLAKRIATGETPGHILYRQFKLDVNGNVEYDYTFAKEKLGDFYDDWFAATHIKIRRVELELNNRMMYARAFVSGNAALARRDFYERAGDQATLIMALYDSYAGGWRGPTPKLIKVINHVGYETMENVEASEDASPVSNLPTL